MRTHGFSLGWEVDFLHSQIHIFMKLMSHTIRSKSKFADEVFNRILSHRATNLILAFSACLL